MGGGEFGRALAAAGLRHPFPQRHRLARVEAGCGSQHQPHFIRLRFVGTRIWQCRGHAIGRHHSLHGARIHSSGGTGHLPDLLQLAARHPLRAVAHQRVGDLVAHHRRHAVLVLGHRHQAGVDRHLAARQGERIGLVGLDHVDRPVETGGEIACLDAAFGGQVALDLVDLVDQPRGDAGDLPRDLRIRIDRAFLAEDLAIRLQAQGAFLLGIQGLVDQHLLAGVRIHGAIGKVVVRAIEQQRAHYQQAQAAATAA